MASQTFDRLAPFLESYRVVVPDLPGFGASSRNVPDYSIQAHAVYLLELLDRLGIARVHLVGYSQGGGVALEMLGRGPERVASVTLLSSIGVQELELLGDYHLNHALYAVQFAFFALLQEGVPHFGYLDDTLLSVAYARNFCDSDQRPLRGILQQCRPPMLILHGRKDRLVPPAAAIEHHRLVPQSELELFDGGHGLLFSRPELLAARITNFVSRVEDGRACTREAAAPDRVASAAEPFDWSRVPPLNGITLAVVLLLLVVSTYVTEDLTCIAAGLMVARGLLSFIPAVAACVLGIYTGDLLLFLAGKYLGRPALRRAPLRWFVRETGIEASREWFARKGPMVILLSRFIPGARLTTYVAAGLLNTPLLRFSFFFLLAALIWTPILVGASAFLGARAIAYLETYSRYSLPAALVLALLLWILVKLVLPAATFRGRRLLLGRWRRLTHWEFWPPWAFYPPVVLYVLYLGLKHRGLTLFTAANPAMPAGGFIGESKTAILDGLAGAGNFLARARVLPRIGGMDAAREWMHQRGWAFPVVLKPDAGERGTGVRIVRSEEELEDGLRVATVPTMLQEFVPGREFGVFYCRMPDEETGRIFAITDKQLPVVTGDGRSTLEELILRDERAVCMAPLYMEKQAGRLYDVPAAGEAIELVELGTHCLGGIFLEGSWVKTEAIEEAFDRISKTYEGFYFGRYDIRTPSVEEFRQGRDFKIVELNGVTSEATNIYDPCYSVFAAWRILMRQWRLAFELGARNRARGVRPTSATALLRLLFTRTRPQA